MSIHTYWTHIHPSQDKYYRLPIFPYTTSDGTKLGAFEHDEWRYIKEDGDQPVKYTSYKFLKHLEYTWFDPNVKDYTKNEDTEKEIEKLKLQLLELAEEEYSDAYWEIAKKIYNLRKGGTNTNEQ